jgi:glycine dehydrogenase subunit 1
MLDSLGLTSISELFSEIPDQIKFKREYCLNKAMSELEVTKVITDLAKLNTDTTDHVSFLGAGSYDHYIPSIIKHITGRSEFYTAYTPYQPEVAQGTLQYIFEYQSMMTELTGLDVSNASMYDGAPAVSEAISMACGVTKRNKILMCKGMHPHITEVVKTYAHYRQFEIVMIDYSEGLLTREVLAKQLDESVAAVVVSNPNFFGLVDDYSDIGELIHKNKSLLIMSVNPMSLAMMKSPGEMGCDICVGDAQVFGLPQNFGGPYLGFLTTTKKLMRKMPGRICGQTTDVDGKRAFVLTLQAREQHIRRDKANSNICSNQSLNVLGASVYLATMGKQGLVDVFKQNIQKANYAYKQLLKLPLFEAVYDQPFFNEFVVKSSVDYKIIQKTLNEANIIAGLHLGEYDEDHLNQILFCVTEKRTKAEIDQLVSVLGGIK